MTAFDLLNAGGMRLNCWPTWRRVPVASLTIQFALIATAITIFIKAQNTLGTNRNAWIDDASLN